MKKTYVPCQLKGEMTRRARFISQFFTQTNEGKLLDVGAGRGDLKKFISPPIEYHPIDINKIDLPNSKKVDLNNGRIPYKKNSFDYVVCCSVLEHLFYPDKISKEISRVLKPSGFAIIGLPNELSVSCRLKFLFKRSFGNIEDEYYGHHWWFDLRNSRTFLEHYFKIVETKTYVGVMLKNVFPIIKYFPSFCGEMFYKVVKL